MKRLALRLLVISAAAVFLVRLFWLREYHVLSGSMEPTIHGSESGGEYVLVAFGPPAELERFDLVVVRVDGREEPLVKRAAGLPGESVEIQEGDFLVDGHRLAMDAPRPEPVLVFDERVDRKSVV